MVPFIESTGSILSIRIGQIDVELNGTLKTLARYKCNIDNDVLENYCSFKIIDSIRSGGGGGGDGEG